MLNEQPLKLVAHLHDDPGIVRHRPRITVARGIRPLFADRAAASVHDLSGKLLLAPQSEASDPGRRSHSWTPRASVGDDSNVSAARDRSV
jgi:hypothetical protein